MYAIVEDSGGQLMLKEGDVVDVDLRELKDNAKSITFDRVLMIGGEGVSAKVGAPYLSGASVKAEIVDADFKGEKIDIVKYKRRKGSKTKQGHRQRYMKVRIASIKA